MTPIACLIRNVLRPTLAVFLFLGITHFAVAHHDADIIHGCIQGSSIRIVGSPDDCAGSQVPVALATEASVQAGSGDLVAFVKRLHGRTVAVFDLGMSGGGSDPQGPGGFRVSILFCDKDMLNPPPAFSCDNTNATFLVSPLITPADSGTVIRLDSSTANFSALAQQVTNGENDIVIFQTQFINGEGNPTGGGSSGRSERTWFFGGNGAVTQVTSGPDFTDLEGFEVDSVNIAVDFIFVEFDPNTGNSSYAFNYRILIGIAP
jgi:hypothetical protein